MKGRYFFFIGGNDALLFETLRDSRDIRAVDVRSEKLDRYFEIGSNEKANNGAP